MARGGAEHKCKYVFIPGDGGRFAEKKGTCACDAPINLFQCFRGGGQLKQLQMKMIGRAHRVGCLKKSPN